MEKREREEKSGKRGFDFEDLTVYQIAREVLRRLAGWAAKPPRKAAPVADHLDRALDSVLLNIAEGSGKEAGSKDRARFYRIALGSAKEAAAALDILAIRGLISPALADHACDGLLQVVRMLHRMAG
jgi:four helix bundle protein